MSHWGALQTLVNNQNCGYVSAVNHGFRPKAGPLLPQNDESGAAAESGKETVK